MALRIRQDGRILCAAHSEPETGDLYLDDYVHSYIGNCIPNMKPDKQTLNYYDWETHEYFIESGSREIPKTATKLLF
jgi:hypothetical protein